MVTENQRSTSNGYPILFGLKNIKNAQKNIKGKEKVNRDEGRKKETKLPPFLTLFKLGFLRGGPLRLTEFTTFCSKLDTPIV